MTKLSAAATAALVLSMTVAGCGGGEKKPDAAPPKPGTPAAAAPSMAEVKVDPATAGTISCKVMWKGAAPKLKPLDTSVKEGGKCTSLHGGELFEEHTIVGDGGALANFIVSIKTGPAVNVKSPAPTTPVVLDQKGCTYIPHVFAMRAGQPLELKNSDPFGHNVHSGATLNPAANETMNAGVPNVKKMLNVPEIFSFQCEVHTWMSAHVGVFAHNYFGVSGKDGMVSMKDVPPGDYTLEARHEKWGTQKGMCKVTDKGAATVTFTFEDNG